MDPPFPLSPQPLLAASANGHLGIAQLLAVFGANHDVLMANPYAPQDQWGQDDWTQQRIIDLLGESPVRNWLTAVQAWTPVQIAAGCRLHSAGTYVWAYLESVACMP